MGEKIMEGIGEAKAESELVDRREYEVALLEILKISAELNAPDISVDRIMESITETSNLIVRSSFSALFTLDEKTGKLVMTKSYKAPQRYARMVSEGFSISVGEGPAGTAFQRQEPLLVEDLLNNPLFIKWQHLAKQEKYNAIYSFPIGAVGRPKFVLNLYFKDPHPRISKDQLTLLETFAHQAGVAFHRASLDSERRQTQKEIEHLASFPRLNPSPILEADSTGTVIFYNTATVETMKNLGVVGGPSIFLPRDMKEILKAFEQKKETRFYREVKIMGRTFGENIYLASEFNTIRIYAADITERIKAEEELKQRLEELEKFHKLSVGRELKMIELKEQIKKLEERIKDFEGTK